MEKGVRALVESHSRHCEISRRWLRFGGGRGIHLSKLLEHRRPERADKFVECNLTMAAVLDSRSNSTTITSTYAGKVAVEYEANYMTKEGSGVHDAHCH